ncbi:hypothetical protein [Synoicihabitans lomoniglobus]|uniref:Uncharacterized protein n=1 Tax=Synoicihabitans lomoniglobus TaxID=2909285 RepID=A0AAF0CQ42_9BACT|nr:hypothetical protein [Opitutaceae bacterium LMO-M01]WED65974.1 hypothetical protein PXH66_03810 [Opitutaceae bacterium LMO-M01]
MTTRVAQVFRTATPEDVRSISPKIESLDSALRNTDGLVRRDTSSDDWYFSYFGPARSRFMGVSISCFDRRDHGIEIVISYDPAISHDAPAIAELRSIMARVLGENLMGSLIREKRSTPFAETKRPNPESLDVAEPTS